MDQIEKIFYRVYDQLGYGLSEKAYQTAIMLELGALNFNAEEEVKIVQKYTTSTGLTCVISMLRMDIKVTDPDIIIELKTIKSELDLEFGCKELVQLERYMKLSGIENGFLVNFNIDNLQIIRVEKNKTE